jgi:flavodoxin
VGAFLVKALIVYDSLYVNTEKIAKAIGNSLTPSGEVKVLRAGEVSLSEMESVDLLLVGSPTQGGSLSPAIKELLSKIPANALKNVSVAAFDTRLKSIMVRPFGYASGRIANSLKDKGGRVVAPPEGFIVNIAIWSLSG